MTGMDSLSGVTTKTHTMTEIHYRRHSRGRRQKEQDLSPLQKLRIKLGLPPDETNEPPSYADLKYAARGHKTRAFQAIVAELEVRSFDPDNLSKEQKQILKNVAAAIKQIFLKNPQTIEEINQIAKTYDMARVRAETNLKTVDKKPLLGFGNDKVIYLQKSLENNPILLHQYAIEEIVESGFQKAFSRRSVGNFGAAVLLRIKSKPNDESIDAESKLLLADEDEVTIVAPNGKKIDGEAAFES